MTVNAITDTKKGEQGLRLLIFILPALRLLIYMCPDVHVRTWAFYLRPYLYQSYRVTELNFQ